MRNLNELDSYRSMDWEIRAMGAIGDSRGGCFIVQHNGVQLAVMASAGGGWDHISVSIQDEARCPTWGELEHIRKLFAKSSETWMQLHVPEKEHVNCHSYCLHLWRPMHREIHKPPSIFVGPVSQRAAGGGAHVR